METEITDIAAAKQQLQAEVDVLGAVAIALAEAAHPLEGLARDQHARRGDRGSTRLDARRTLPQILAIAADTAPGR